MLQDRIESSLLSLYDLYTRKIQDGRQWSILVPSPALNLRGVLGGTLNPRLRQVGQTFAKVCKSGPDSFKLLQITHLCSSAPSRSCRSLSSLQRRMNLLSDLGFSSQSFQNEPLFFSLLCLLVLCFKFSYFFTFYQ